MKTARTTCRACQAEFSVVVRRGRPPLYCTRRCSRIQHGRSFCACGSMKSIDAARCRACSVPSRRPVRTCGNCRVEFVKKKTGGNKGMFCSRECAYQFKAAKPKPPKPLPACSRCGVMVEAGKRARQKKYCLACRRRVNVEKTLDPPRLKVCRVCDGEFMAGFGTGKHGRTIACSAGCKAEVYRQMKNRGKSRRRARLKACLSEPYSRLAVFRRDAWTCKLCGKVMDRKTKFPSPDALTIDHVLPIAKGGSDTLENVQTACFACNSLKRDTVGVCHADLCNPTA